MRALPVMLGAAVVGALLAASLPANALVQPRLSAKSAIVPELGHKIVNMRYVPAALPWQILNRRTLPLMVGMDPRTYMLRKQYAAHNPFAPVDLSPPDDAMTSPFTTPGASPKFNGMNDASACGGCEPPDMAVAASKQWVVQGVNTSFAVYGPTGVLQAGWPKTAVSFFGIPNPSPSGCDSGPFTSDPRAFYDPNDDRFWVAILQVEGNFGVAPGCNPLSMIWVAVSKTNDPRGSWNVYGFNMDLTGNNSALDYTQLGFDDQAVYFGGNMFGPASGGTPFEWDEIVFGSKAVMEGGGSVTAHAFYKFGNGTSFYDTVQPVETETTAAGAPGVEYLINTDDFGTGGCSAPCKDVVAWAIASPITSPTASGFILSTFNAYTDAPQADEPGCTQCIETLDTRISATPVYTASRGSGLISFALETGVASGGGAIPAVLWGEVHPTLNASKALTGLTKFQAGYIKGSGDQANSFGATMAANDGSLWIVNDRMSSTINPGIVYRVQRHTDPLGHLQNTLTLKAGAAPTVDSRWGDFEATSLDALAGGHTWLASQYSGAGGDWATFIGRDI